MSKFIAPPVADPRAPSLTSRLRARLESLDVLLHRRGARVVGRELEEALVSGDRGLWVVRGLGRRSELELDGGVVRRPLRHALVGADGRRVGGLHLLVGGRE